MKNDPVFRYVMRELEGTPSDAFDQVPELIQAYSGDVAACAVRLQGSSTVMATREAMKGREGTDWSVMLAAADIFMFAQLSIAASVGVSRLLNEKRRALFFDAADLVYLLGLYAALGVQRTDASDYAEFLVANRLVDPDSVKPIPFMEVAPGLVDMVRGRSEGVRLSYDEPARRDAMSRTLGRRRAGSGFNQLALYVAPVELYALTDQKIGWVPNCPEELALEIPGFPSGLKDAISAYVSQHRPLVSRFMEEVRLFGRQEVAE